MKQKEAIEKALKNYVDGKILDVVKNGKSCVYCVLANWYEFEVHPHYPSTIKNMTRMIDIKLKSLEGE